MGMRNVGGTSVQAPSVGGTNNDSGGAFHTLITSGKGGAISYDAKTYSVFGVDHEVTLTSRHADGSARTWQATTRDGIKGAWQGFKGLFGAAKPRQAAPKARKLGRVQNRGMLLGRKSQNPRNLSRLQQLHPAPVNNGSGVNSGSSTAPSTNPQSPAPNVSALNGVPNANNLAHSHTSASPPKGIKARGQLLELSERITERLDPQITTFRNNKRTTDQNKQAIAGSFWKRNFRSKTERAAIRTSQAANVTIAKDVNRLGNDALNRLSNLETTLRSNSRSGRLSPQQAQALSDSRKKVLRAMIETRLPGLNNAGGPARIGQALRNLLAGQRRPLNQEFSNLQQAVDAFDNARNPDGQRAALDNINDVLWTLKFKNQIDRDQYSSSKQSLDQIGRELAIDETIDELCKLEQENSQDTSFQHFRSALLNNITKFGHTRDWAASTDVGKQRRAAESVKALAQS
ncbi:MAG: hypothetical protein AAFY56_12205, partial [Pseudomonadota bacterium]